MPRKNKILIRTGSGAPSPSDFATSEPAWDGVGKVLYVKANDGTMAAINGGGGTGVTDGDKGDITVSGATWTIDNGAVTLAKTTGLQKAITSGTSTPTGGADGDIYIQYY